MSLRRALEAKAALYERLSRGEGLSADSDGEEGEGEERYMVDFTRKIAEEVSVCDCVYVCIQYFPSRSSLLLEPETLISTLTKRRLMKNGTFLIMISFVLSFVYFILETRGMVTLSPGQSKKPPS